jgi:hypothetical protein
MQFLFALLLGVLIGAGGTAYLIQSDAGNLLVRRTEVVQDLQRRLDGAEEQRNQLSRQLEIVVSRAGAERRSGELPAAPYPRWGRGCSAVAVRLGPVALPAPGRAERRELQEPADQQGAGEVAAVSRPPPGLGQPGGRGCRPMRATARDRNGSPLWTPV